MLKFKNVLSCFDGASCAQMALKRAGIEFQNYYPFTGVNSGVPLKAFLMIY